MDKILIIKVALLTTILLLFVGGMLYLNQHHLTYNIEDVPQLFLAGGK